MEWTEETPISPDNLNNLETRINNATASVATGKTTIAAAITAMGQAAAGNDTFTELAAKIRDISDDADAAVGNVLSGKTFYQGGSKKTGTMPNRGGVNSSATGVDGIATPGRIYLRPLEGYWDGIYWTYWDDPNFVAENIPNGVNIFGLAGNSTRKKWAQISVAGYTVPFESYYDIPVTGIDFIPSIAILTHPGAFTLGGWTVGYMENATLSNIIAVAYNNPSVTQYGYFPVNILNVTGTSCTIRISATHSSLGVPNGTLRLFE